MKSRQRLLFSLEHKEPDRVPIDLGSTPSSGISAVAYGNLKKHLGIETGANRIYDVVQQLAWPEDKLIDMFDIDVLDVGRMFNNDESCWHDVTLPGGINAKYPFWFYPEEQPDGSMLAYSKDGKCVGKMAKGATFFDQTIFPYEQGFPGNYKSLSKDMSFVVWEALAHSPWDNAHKQDFWKDLRTKTLDLRQNSDRALMIVCGCNLFEWGTFLRRMDNFLADLYIEPEQVSRLLDALLEIHLDTLSKVCEAVGDIVDVIRFGDDLGMETGPFMSPEVYRKLFKPRHKMLCDHVKSNSKMKTFLHTCGSVYRLLPDLIEAGYDIINPVQTTAFEMEPERLKKEFGNDLVFWGGGCDTRHILNNAGIKEVKEDVKRRLDILSPGGGFVFCPIHNIMPDVPPQNIVAMFEAVDEFFA